MREERVSADERIVGGLRLDRLEALLAHMEKGKLSVDRFDFGCFREQFTCGTAGCMAGELPAVFPEEWEFVEKYRRWLPRLKGQPDRVFTDSAMEFFGITFDEVQVLFYPVNELNKRHLDGMPPLDENATCEAVTTQLRVFIHRKRGEVERAREAWRNLRVSRED